MIAPAGKAGPGGIVKKNWLHWTCTLALLIAPSAFAEPAEEAKQKQETTDEYVEVNLDDLPTLNTITTKLPVSALHTPANVGLVSAPLIREQDASVLSGALRNISGINVQSNAGVHDYFLIRGFDSVSSSLVLTDGAPEPEASFYNTYNLEAVEVLKGPAAFLYGINNPLGGVINLVRKQPLMGNFSSFGATVGSFDTAKANLDWNLSNQGGSFAFRLNATVYDTAGYRDEIEARQFGINPGFVWRFGSDSSLSVNLEYVDAEFMPDAGLPLVNGAIAGVDRENNYGSPFDFSDQNLSKVQVDYENRLNGRVLLRNKTYFRELDWQTNGTQLLGAQDFGFGPQAFRNLSLLDDRQTFVGNQVEAVIEFGTGNVRHKLLTGIEAANLRDEFSLDVAMLPFIDVMNPVDSATGFTAFPFFGGDLETDIIAPYVMDDIRFSDRFRVFVGARYDDFSQKDKLSGATLDDSKASPMAGAVFSPMSTLSVYANAGSSFFPASPRVTGPLEPEDGDQYELGLKKQFLGGKMYTNFALYRINRQNIAIPDSNGFTQQVGDQQSQGAEIELAAECRNGLRTFVSYAYNDSELTRFSELIVTGPGPADFVVFDRSGMRPAFTPEHMLNLWISRKFAGRWTLGGGARFIDEQYIDEDNAFAIDSSVVVDAMAAVDLGQTRLRLNVKNLLDEDYEIRGFGASAVIPAQPFAAFLSLEFRR